MRPSDGAMAQLLFWLSSSLGFGWVSPLLLDLGRTFKELDLINHPRINEKMVPQIRKVINAWEYRLMEVEFQNLLKECRLPRADPNETTIIAFRPKSSEIFSGLSRNASDTIHIEFRQVPRAPFPTVVFVLYPSQKKLVKVIRLSDALQLSPFSKESFEFVWIRIAFELHLGKRPNNERVRPAVFTVLDSHGNREFAAFLTDRIRGTPGTAVRLVSHETTIKSKKRTKKRSQATLGETIRDLEAQILQVPGLFYDVESAAEDIMSRTQQDFVRSDARDIFSSLDQGNQKLLLEKASLLKGQGNDLFASSNYNGAVRRYAVAIHLLSLLVEQDVNSYKLLGTLLSNRAACFLELESQRNDLEFRKVLAKYAIKDCTIALDSTWASTSLPRNILEKLTFRRDKASARYDALCNQIYLDPQPVPTLMLPGSAPVSSAQPYREDNERPSQPEQTNGSPEMTQAMGNTTANTIKDGTTTPSTSRDALMEFGQVIFDNSLARNATDGCPVCLREFSTELARTYTAVLPCGEHAMCVECISALKKQSDQANEILACPLCRQCMDKQFVQDLAYQIIDVDQELALLVVKLPFGDANDKVDAAKRLLWTNNFRVDAVVDALESMLDDQASSLFFRTKGNWNHQQKEDIYVQARQPVEVLRGKLQRLLEERSTTFDNARLTQLNRDLWKVRSDLAVARTRSREEIYRKMNSVGSMGAQIETSDEKDGLIQLDFHGLHVNEMQEKFTEQVKPILPVVQKLTIITGRGLHSADGESKLMKALKKRIETTEKDIRWEKVDNPGALNILWVSERMS